MSNDFDYSTVEAGDLLTFEDGTVCLVRGIIDQEDQWVFQLHTGEDLRVAKPVAADDAEPTLPKA